MQTCQAVRAKPSCRDCRAVNRRHSAKSTCCRPRPRRAAQRGYPPAAALRITVVNGDLTYISEPLLIGHYRSSRLTGTEAAMDRAVGGAMNASLQRGLYPTAPGTYQVFVNVTANADNPWQLPRPEAVIVAGLGAEGELRGSDLVNTVRQAVIGWAQRLTERSPVPRNSHLRRRCWAAAAAASRRDRPRN